MPPLAGGDNHALYQLRESALVDQYPQETARLLIYLANGIPAYQVGFLAEVAARLVNLPPEVRQRLDEALARAGAVWALFRYLQLLSALFLNSESSADQ